MRCCALKRSADPLAAPSAAPCGRALQRAGCQAQSHRPSGCRHAPHMWPYLSLGGRRGDSGSCLSPDPQGPAIAFRSRHRIAKPEEPAAPLAGRGSAIEFRQSGEAVVLRPTLSNHVVELYCIRTAFQEPWLTASRLPLAATCPAPAPIHSFMGSGTFTLPDTSSRAAL